MPRCGRFLIACFLFLGVLLAAPHANADNIAIANATACSGTPPGGTICSNGSGGLQGTGGVPFSLSGIENGSVVLQVSIGTQTAPVYEVINDTGITVTTDVVSYRGKMRSPHNCH